jgi:hypothetical protein
MIGADRHQSRMAEAARLAKFLPAAAYFPR